MGLPFHPQPKGEPGRLALKTRRAKIRTARRNLKVAAKRRDGYRCVWPRADHDTPDHVCLGPLESAHRIAIGMGGDRDGSRTSTADLLTVCHWIHQDSPDAIEKGGRTWEGLTPDGADGPIRFLRRGQEVARERRVRELERATRQTRKEGHG